MHAVTHRISGRPHHENSVSIFDRIDPNMKVRVKLHGETKRHVKGLVGDIIDVDIDSGLSVGQLIDHLGIEHGDVWLSAVNKTLVKSEHILADGDAVEVFAPVVGG